MQERFIVPQFIDTEDKILGPITVRQFVIVLVGALFEFLSYKLADFGLFLLETIIIAVLVGAFAFYKVNGMPFHVFAVNFIETTFKKPRIRVWHKEHIKVQEFKNKDEDKKTEEIIPRKSPISHKKLSELSLIIDTGGIYKGEKDANIENNAV